MSYRRTSITLAVLCGSLASLALTAAPALAAKIHVFSTSFSLANSASPSQVAINQSTGEVYATSTNSGVVDAFEASGTPDPIHPKLTEANGTTPYPFANPYGVAVDNSAQSTHGDLYVANTGTGTVLQFDPTGARTAQAPIAAANVPAEGTTQSGGLPPVVNNHGFNPGGVAVASDGDLYVSDFSNNVIDVFEPNGTFVLQFASGHLAGAYAIALDSSRNLYVADGSSGTIEFAATGACVNSCTSIDPSGLWGVATDPEGNVYAAEGGSVAEFTPSGEPIDSFGQGILSFGRGMAFNETSGAIYVADENTGKVDVFKAITVPDVTMGSPSNILPGSALISAHLDPSGGEEITECFVEYGTEFTPDLGKTPCSPPAPYTGATDVRAELTGLTGNSTYHTRLVAADAEGPAFGVSQTFATPLPYLPTVESTSASNFTPVSATLQAQINSGFGSTVYRFQYGTGGSYGSSTPLSELTGSDISSQSASSSISNLAPATTYHFRVVAINFSGTAHGPDQTFTTPDLPALTGANASNVTSSTATLSAQVNPQGAATTYHFDYGTGTSYGSSTAESASIGADATPHSVSSGLANLTPATTYHFRLVATNAFGTTTGLDQTFSTAAPPAGSQPPESCRKRGLVKKHGKCVKKPHRKSNHHKSNHHRRGGAR